MDCLYRRYIEMGGIGGTMSDARRAALLKAHQRHHSKCPPFRPAVLDEFVGMFTFHGDDGGDPAGVRGARERAHRQALRAREPRACRVCGAEDCAKPECFRALLAAEADLAFRQRLATHAAAAARDAATRRNGCAR